MQLISFIFSLLFSIKGYILNYLKEKEIIYFENQIREEIIKWRRGETSYVDLSNLGLKKLPALPNDIKILDISNNYIETIEHFPNQLQTLYARNNCLKTLPPFPSSLLYLYISNNELVELPPLPKSIRILRCENNQLTEIPFSIENKFNLNTLRVYNNPLPKSLQIETELRSYNIQTDSATDIEKYVSKSIYTKKYKYLIELRYCEAV